MQIPLHIWSYVEKQEKAHLGLAKSGLNIGVVLIAEFYCSWKFKDRKSVLFVLPNLSNVNVCEWNYVE